MSAAAPQRPVRPGDVPLKLAVVIPTLGRSEVVDRTIDSVLRQNVLPEVLLLSVTSELDVPPRYRRTDTPVRTVVGPKGLPVQRNAAIDALDGSVDVVMFLDDDVELAVDYTEQVMEAFATGSDVAVICGSTLYDGAISGEISRDEALTLTRQHVRSEAAGGFDRREGASQAYGCNLSVRARVARAVRFDERLVLYGYLEDRDFGQRCLAHGRVRKLLSARLVHLAVSSGRVNGKRYGFCQIVNPYYLWRKGSLSFADLAYHWGRALAANFIYARLRFRRWDRRGRVAGNLAGLREVLRGGRPETAVDHA